MQEGNRSIAIGAAFTRGAVPGPISLPASRAKVAIATTFLSTVCRWTPYRLLIAGKRGPCPKSKAAIFHFKKDAQAESL
jgi:hypothetical protein